MIFKKGRKRVLVVDDDQDFRNVMEAVLDFAGFKVETVGNGEAALKEVKKRKYDLLILDVFMEKIDGVKLFQMVRKSKRYANTPVLFVSGQSLNAEFDERKREIIAQADGYIQKPFQTKVLMEKVREVLENS